MSYSVAARLAVFVIFLKLLSLDLTVQTHAQTDFQMVTDLGVSDILPFEQDNERAYLYYTGHAGGAICLGDVNADGLNDVYFSRGPQSNVLYLNQGDWKLKKRTGPFGGGQAWGTGATLVDVDSDGDLDLCQVNYDSPIQFFLNDGTGNFTPVANAFGLGVTDASLAVSFADVDNDGDLDAFILCNTYFSPKGRPAEPPIEMVNGKPMAKAAYEKYYTVVKNRQTGQWEMDEYGRRDYLFLNVGTRSRPKFRDVSEASGINKLGFGLSCVWWDYNNDGLIDLSVSNDFLEPDRLYRNMGLKDGIPQFVDVIESVFPTTAWSSMGSGIADVNNDGLAELMTVDMSARSHFKAKLNMGEMQGEQRWVMENGWPRQVMRNHLYVNADNGSFREEAWMRGLASTDWSWAVKWGDYDEDGWSDVLVTNGMTRNFTDSDFAKVIGPIHKAQIGHSLWDLYRDQPPMLEANVVYRNLKGKRFQEVGESWGLDLVGISYGAASGDLDGDGDLDLVVTDLGQPLRFYRNETDSARHRLRVRLVGTTSNQMAVGAKVTVTDASGSKRTRWMLPWVGFQSQDEPVLHFGLGEQTAASVQVVWPGGDAQTLVVPSGRNELTITQAATDTPDAQATASPWWQPKMLPWRHVEKSFDDFAKQPLLPGKLSQPGPCFAAADIDNDGDMDAYLGGAVDQPGALLVNFRGQLRVGAADWGKGTASEDVAATWFDADNDGDLDLYVVSGSVEHPPGDERYRDRLYRNDSKAGQFAFEQVTGALPDLRDSGSCVVAADYDADGDLDLFVGSRSVVNRYPVSPQSRLLRNESADGNLRFVDVTKAAAPGLLTAGLTTDAIWADLDGDEDPDLVLATEWGPIQIFWNDGGMLQENEHGAIVEKTGWWQTVSAGDFDNDGDLDLLAGNVGWNTKYKHPTPKKPAEIYYGDMDQSGTSRIIEAKNADGALLPVRGKSCSTHAIPALGGKFKSYRDFASSDLLGIYGQKCLSDAERFVATDLASGWWKNLGNGKFEWTEFPWEVQVSQVNDFAVGDIDGDGQIEIVVAQNEDAREPETGLWRGGLGVVMRFVDNDWMVVPTAQTGFALRGAVKDIALMDVDGNGRLELLVGQNGAPLVLLQ